MREFFPTIARRAAYPRLYGFTLIELMVTVVIVAILAMVVYPSYQNYTVRVGRSDAQIALTQAANQQERFFTECNWYAKDPTGARVCNTSTTGVLGLTTTDSPSGYYTIAIAQGAINASMCAAYTCGYTLTATPKAGGRQANDGAFRMDSTGAKQWDKDKNNTWCCKWTDR